MDRAEATGFSVAVVGHIALLAVLTLGLARATLPDLASDSIEVSFVEDVGLTSASPEPDAQPAPGAAPETGPTEDAEPAPSPEPTPTPPLPKQAEIAPSPPRQQARPTRERPPVRQPAAGQGQRTRRSLLDPNFLDGIGRDPSQSRSRQSPGAVMSAQAAASIADAIRRQVQPCADRQVYPGPGAERIVTPIILRLNRDGSLATRPRVGQQRGLDDENGRYAERVADLAVRSFAECAPLRGLPAELYDVPRGWSNFTMNYRLPG